MSDSAIENDDASEQGPASPRTTIVGGQPSSKSTELAQIPVGIQRLLRLASLDEGFRCELVEHRAGAARAAGVELRAAEEAILNAVPASQLEQMARMMPPPAPPRREFLRQTAATAVVLLGGAAFAEAASACSPRDTPPPDHIRMAGQQVDVPPEPSADAGLGPTSVDPNERIMPNAGVRPEPAPPPEPGLPNAGASADLPPKRDE